MYNDYELLYLAKEEKDLIGEILYKKYKGIIYTKAIKYSPFNLLIEDFINEGKSTLYESIENYQDKYNFSTYLNNCLDNNLSNYRKAVLRNKNKILNEAISFEEIKEIRTYNDRYNPEISLYEEYDYEELKNKIINKLTWKEELIFTLKEQNYTNKEISEITDNSLRTVYNIINRIKNKVSNIVSN